MLLQTAALQRLGGLVSQAPASLGFSRAFSMVPMVIETTSRGERAFDIYSRLLRYYLLLGTNSKCQQRVALHWASCHLSN